jgi:transmembrane sensor
MTVSKADIEWIDRAAGDWLARRDGNRWTAADQAAFDQWLAASTLHRVAYLRLEHAWEEAGRLKAFGAGIFAERVPRTGHLYSWFHRRRQTSRSSDAATWHPRRRLRWTAAAAVVGVAVVAYLLDAVFLAERRYSTPVGRVASISLRDGSKVTLNTDTEIRVLASSQGRDVQLERGEAFFQVARNPGRTFLVEVGNKRIIAVGTKFAVRRNAGDIGVVVTEGKVWVETTGASHELTQLLPAGSVARAGDTGMSVETESVAEADDYIAWVRGVLVFHDVTLAEAASEFNRYNRRRIVIEDPNVAEFRIAGAFRWSNVNGFVRLLEQGYPIRVLQGEEQIVLKSYATH